MPNVKADPKKASYQDLIQALVALPPADDVDVFALLEEQSDDCQITGGVPLTLVDLERVTEVLQRPSKIDRLVLSLAALPAAIAEDVDDPYF